MKNTVEVYSHQIHLSNEFTTARGSLKSKETFIFVAKDPEGTISSYVELPLSPSMGLSHSEFHDLLKNAPQRFRHHPLIERTLTWLNLRDEDLPTKNILSPPLRIQTIGIHSNPPEDPDITLKLKGSPDNLNEIIETSQVLARKKQNWMVDFNGSLDQSELLHFEEKADLTTCLWIEQPLPAGKWATSRGSSTRVFLDEEMQNTSLERFLQSQAQGFVLKPWRYSVSEYQTWHRFAEENNIPYIVGSMIQSPIADLLCDKLNQFAPIRYETQEPYLRLDVVEFLNRAARQLVRLESLANT